MKLQSYPRATASVTHGDPRGVRLDSVTIPEYFAPPRVFSLSSERRVTQWMSTERQK